MPKTSINNTIAIHSLRELSKRELSGLYDFIQSAYFNPNKNLIKLYEYIQRFAPHYKDENFTPENAYQAVYPEKKFNAKALNTLMSQLGILIRKFIHCQQTASERHQFELSTLRFWAERNEQKERFNHQLGMVRRQAQQLKGVEFHRYTFNIEDELVEFMELSGDKVDFEDMSKALDQYYWIKKLSILCEKLNQQSQGEKEHNLAQLDNCLDFVEKSEYLQFPLVHLWYCLATTFKDILHQKTIQPDKYYEFKKLLLDNKEQLSENEKRNLFVYLINIRERTSFEADMYYKEQLETLKIRLEEEIIFVNNAAIPSSTAINIITLALRNNDISWAEDFLAKYKTQFKGEKYDVLYCEANINSCKNNYDTALKQLKKVKFKDIRLKLGKRVKSIQIYYDTGDIDSLDNEISNFKSYISRQKKKYGEEVIHPYQKFRYFVYHIVQVASFEKEKLKELKVEIEQTPAKKLPEKQWLIQKINDK